MDLVDTLGREWRVIAGAPLTILAVATLAAGGSWAAAHSRQRSRIKALESDLGQTRAEVSLYQERLQVASPDDAKAKIDALRSRLRNLEPPPRLTPSQWQSAHAAAASKTGRIAISHDSGIPAKAQLTADLREIFSRAGWKVFTGATTGADDSPSGAVLYLRAGGKDVDAVRNAVTRTLEAVGVAHETEERDGMIYDVQIVFTRLAP